MKFALGEIRQIKEPMARLLDKELPVKVSWRLNKLIKSFDRELVGIEQARIDLVKKYGVTDNEGNTKVSDEDMPKFVTEYNEFLNEQVDIEFEPVSIDVLGDVNISTKDVMMMDKLFI